MAAAYNDMIKMGAASLRLVADEYGGMASDTFYAFDKGSFSLADKDGEGDKCRASECHGDHRVVL